MLAQQTLQRGWYILRRSPLLLIGGINGAVMILSVIMSLVIVRILVKEEYGHLVYFYAGFGLLRLFMNFGLGFSISRDIAGAASDPQRLRVILYSTLLVRIIVNLGALLILGVLASFTEQPYLGYMLAAGIIASFADLTFSMITGLRKVRAVGLVTMAQPVSYAVFVLLLAATGMATSTGLMAAYTASFAVMLLLGVLLLISAKVLPLPDRASVDWHYVRASLSFIIPVYVSSLVSQAWISFSTGWFGWHQQFEQAAEFGVVFNLISLLISISSPTLITTFFPHLSYLHKNHGREQVIRYIRSTLALVFYGYLFASVAFFSFPQTAVNLLFGDTYAVSSAYLTILAPAMIAMGVIPLFILSLTALGFPWRALIGLLLQLGILVAGVLLFSTRVDPLMLSWIVLVSSAAGALTQMVLLNNTLKTSIIPPGWWQMLVIGIAAALLLRYLAVRIGVSLSVWHFVAGAVFSAVYWLRALNLEGRSWQTKAN